MKQLRVALAVVALTIGFGWAGDSSPGRRVRDEPSQQSPPCERERILPRRSAPRASSISPASTSRLRARTAGAADVPYPGGGLEHHPGTLQRLFEDDGRHCTPSSTRSTPTTRTRMLHHRRGAPGRVQHDVEPRRVPPGRRPVGRWEWDLIAVDDPHGFATLPTPARALAARDADDQLRPRQRDDQLGRRQQRRARDQLAGLVNQADRNVTGASSRDLPPPHCRTCIDDIVNFETSLFTAQLIVPGVGRLDADGARGGPEASVD